MSTLILTKKQASDIQESRIASALGWSRVSGSGARHLYPGDIVSDEWLGECKTHVEPGHKIKFDSKVWSKIIEESKSRFKYPALFVDDGSQDLSKTWVMFSGNVGLEFSAYILDYRFPVRSNIVFDGGELYRRVQKNIDDGKAIVYRTQFNNSLVYMCTFSYFSMMFGDI